jgi:hypothetical protein
MIRPRWAGHVAHMGEKRGTCKVLVGKLEGKRQLGRCKCRWEATIKIVIKEIVWVSVNWIHLTQDRD